MVNYPQLRYHRMGIPSGRETRVNQKINVGINLVVTDRCADV